ncbi:MAG: GIY-YIG nuclease family protein [Candidatus Phaeomarinobacter sp.]
MYIMTNRKHGTLYVGHTDNIQRRTHEHRTGQVQGFTKSNGLGQLVYAETCATREEARQREQQLKNWQRSWKIQLIEEANPDWQDLFDTLQ